MTGNRAITSVLTQSETRQEVILTAEVRAHAFISLKREQIATARRKPGSPPEGWPATPPSLLRYSDDQTVAALAAAYATLRRMGHSDPRRLESWGILVASRFVGRSSVVVALDRFRSDGVWGVSPHLIPQYALHSPSGTLSLALGIHGPNLGIGGGSWSEFEGILTALTWLHAGIVPALWLIFTGWTPEFVPDQKGEPVADCTCQALALVLAAPGSGRFDPPCFQIIAGEEAESPRPLDVSLLGEFLDQGFRNAGRGTRIGDGQVVHDGHHNAGVPHPHFGLGTRARPHAPARTIATDASGRLKVALVSRRSCHIEEV